MSPRPRRGGKGDDFDAISDRAREAVDRAEQTVARSEVLAAAMRVESESEDLLVQCAWCRRYLLGSRWVTEQELPQLVGINAKLDKQRVSHSVCPDCSNVP
jgi:hypothetical protein